MKIARILTASEQIVWASELDGRLELLEGDMFDGFVPTGKVVEATHWLPPVEPAALLCIGLNYRNHAVEANLPIPKEPILFLKNPSAAIGHLAPILIPKVCEDEVDFECELAVVIGRPCRDVSPHDALNYVFGYTAANDVSARVWQMQRGGSQWCRGKSFDSFAPLGPVLVTTDEIQNPQSLRIKTELNGQVLQDSSTSDMIFDVPNLISFLSQDTTLLPGTVILTGTPEGIGWTRNPKRLLHRGDEVTIEIDKIGRLTNAVR